MFVRSGRQYANMPEPGFVQYSTQSEEMHCEVGCFSWCLKLCFYQKRQKSRWVMEEKRTLLSSSSSALLSSSSVAMRSTSSVTLAAPSPQSLQPFLRRVTEDVFRYVGDMDEQSLIASPVCDIHDHIHRQATLRLFGVSPGAPTPQTIRRDVFDLSDDTPSHTWIILPPEDEAEPVPDRTRTIDAPLWAGVRIDDTLPDRTPVRRMGGIGRQTVLVYETSANASWCKLVEGSSEESRL